MMSSRAKNRPSPSYLMQAHFDDSGDEEKEDTSTRIAAAEVLSRSMEY